MSVNDDASYEIMIEFVADYGFDVLSIGDITYGYSNVGGLGRVIPLDCDNAMCATEAGNPQTDSFFVDADIIEGGATKAFILTVKEDGVFIGDAVFTSTDIMFAVATGRPVKLMFTAGHHEECDVRLHAWLRDEDEEQQDPPQVDLIQHVLRAIRPRSAAELQGDAATTTSDTARCGDHVSHSFDQQIHWPVDDSELCHLLQKQLAYLNKTCAAVTNQAGCTAHRSYYLGDGLLAVECGLCLEIGRRFLTNASLNVRRTDCLWLALQSHLRHFHELSLSKSSAAAPVSEAGPDDQHIGERAAEEQDPDVAALAALFTSSATVSDEVPPLAKKKGGSKTRSESQRRDQPTAPEVTPARRLRSASARAAATDSASATAIESLRTADTALAESSVMGASSSAPGQPTMQLARKDTGRGTSTGTGTGSAEWAKANPGKWRKASDTVNWPPKPILKVTADIAAAPASAPAIAVECAETLGEPKRPAKNVDVAGATFVSLVSVLPFNEQRALRWKGAYKPIAVAERDNERMTVLRYFTDHTVVDMHRFVRYFNGQNWLYTQPRQVRAIPKGSEYPVPAHIVSLRLCSVTFDQFRDAFDRYAAEHLDSAAGKARRAQENRELFDSLTAVVDALKGFGLSARRISTLASVLWLETPEEREVRRAATVALTVAGQDAESDSDSGSDADTPMSAPATRPVLTRTQAQLCTGSAVEEEEPQGKPAQLEQSDGDGTQVVTSEVSTATVGAEEGESDVVKERRGGADLAGADRADEEEPAQEAAYGGTEDAAAVGVHTHNTAGAAPGSDVPDDTATVSQSAQKGTADQVSDSRRGQGETNRDKESEKEPELEEGEPRGGWSAHDKLLLAYRDVITATWLSDHLRQRDYETWTRRTSNALQRAVVLLHCELAAYQSAAQTSTAMRARDKTAKAREKVALKASRTGKVSAQTKSMELQGKALRREVSQVLQKNLFNLAPHLNGCGILDPAVLQWLYEKTKEEGSYANFISVLRAKKRVGQQSVHETLRRILRALHRMVDPVHTA